ncbi:MAG: alanine racemase [Chloroflexi bacterium]|nr:alanine racemase [Chloroflexota bacterium]
MNQHYRPMAGTPVSELDTPCLILDMDALDHNMDVIANYYAGRSSKLRPHSKNHKTPALAHRQMRRGGTVGGVCAAKVSEAEVMVHGGIPSVFITSEVVAPLKIDRLCTLSQQAEMLVACDDPSNAADLSQAAVAQRVNLGVVVEIETGLRRCGVQDIEQGVALAKTIHSLPGLTFKGIMSHQVIPEMPEREDRVTEGYRVIQGVIDVKDAIEAAGIPVEIVSTGETWSYDVAGEIPGVTEVQGGSYLVMETGYGYMTDFHYAGKVLTTVISTPRLGVAVGDAGQKAIATLRGLPEVDDRPGVTVESMDPDRVIFRLDQGAKVSVGDQLTLIPSQQDATVSRWDRFIGVRDGKVEVVWDIQARGCHS